jgi:hypothetical protein
MLATDHHPVLECLLPHAIAGERVYLVVPGNWAGSAEFNRLRGCAKVLVRRVPEVPASGIQLSSTSTVWLGPPTDDLPPWRLGLDAQQAAAWRQLFLRLFWHEGTEEAWSGGREWLFRPARERPFDVPPLSSTAPLQLSPDHLALSGNAGARLHVASDSPPGWQPQRLWFAASGDHHAALAGLARKGTKILWHRMGLPDLVACVDSGSAVLPGAATKLRILLNAEQASEAVGILDGPGSWSFHVDTRLGDHAPDKELLWLSGAVRPATVDAEQAIDMGVVQADRLQEMSSAAPSTWPEPQPLAQTARFVWKVIPPRVPVGAVEDALLAQWRKSDADWMDRLGKARQALQAVEQEQGRVAKAFSRLASALLGFGRKRGELLAHIAELEQARPSVAGPAAAPTLWEKLAVVEEDSQKLHRDLATSEVEAREAEERERQEEAWRKKVKTAEQQLAEKRTELPGHEARLRDAEKSLDSVNEALKKAEKKERKDLSARKQKVSDEVTRVKKQLAIARSEVANLERDATEPFTFKPPTTTVLKPSSAGNRFIPQGASTRTKPNLPSEALPDLGLLRTHHGQRYLVIQTWEQLPQGQQNADRLNARLVAPENA